MTDLDRDLASFWRTILEYSDDIIERIQSFTLSRESVERIDQEASQSIVDHGFRTLVLNRTQYGDVLTLDASLIKIGENGAGIESRWYPKTLVNRLKAIAEFSDKLIFCENDGLCLLGLLCDRPNTAFLWIHRVRRKVVSKRVTDFTPIAMWIIPVFLLLYRRARPTF